ncbi:hypothetical protein JMJ77_0004681 [Colletotrichum scovillei]|uniref:Uncharacterized protein n=1 Tax=Colletotrichum scovillei TaxID=1209932 RepID=A0A9P7RFQ0_9PEZI|nr:hypothetical protein JMJ77_0004681 [Colletotrichum scovillei]KAG7075889.1 hypothetical protein JMJ76_0013163 [Colletotrichum scovillei]KAG7083005.1 hypothetical protein JMJ78_0008456 [Colletotrichum scovillei]
MPTEAEYFTSLQLLLAPDYGYTGTCYLALEERYNQERVFVELGLGGYEDDEGYKAGRMLVDRIFNQCQNQNWLVEGSGPNRFLYDKSLDIMNAPRTHLSGYTLNQLYGIHVYEHELNVSIDDYVVTPFSILCAKLIDDVRSKDNAGLIFFCGLHIEKDGPLRGSTIIRALLHQIFQRNLNYFSADDIKYMYGDFKAMLESPEVGSFALCEMFFRVVKLAEPRLNERDKKMICIIDGLGTRNSDTYSEDVMQVVLALAKINAIAPFFKLICTGPAVPTVFTEKSSSQPFDGLFLWYDFPLK